MEKSQNFVKEYGDAILRFVYNCRPPGFTVMPWGKELSTNNRYKFAAIFIVFVLEYLNNLYSRWQKPEQALAYIRLP